MIFYALFSCVIGAGSPSCTFMQQTNDLAQCQQMSAHYKKVDAEMYPDKRVKVKFVCMKKAIQTWEPAE